MTKQKIEGGFISIEERELLLFRADLCDAEANYSELLGRELTRSESNSVFVCLLRARLGLRHISSSLINGKRKKNA